MTQEVFARVTLTAGDPLFVNDAVLYVGRYIGQQRHHDDVKNHRHPWGEQKLAVILSNNMAGAVAEAVVAARINIYPMLQFTTFVPYNLRLPDQTTVDVQYHATAECVLNVAREAVHRASRLVPPDLYIVVTGTIAETAKDTRLFFAGWCTHAELLASPTDIRNGSPAYVCTRLRSQPLQVLGCLYGQGWCEGVTEKETA